MTKIFTDIDTVYIDKYTVIFNYSICIDDAIYEFRNKKVGIDRWIDIIFKFFDVIAIPTFYSFQIFEF